MEKTNAMRILEQKKLDYTPHQYGNDEVLSAQEVAEALGVEPGRVFKTLVTVGKNGQYYVFMLPALAELDLKQAAKVAGDKAIKMIKSKELWPLTGYVHGGCSPIGMKKSFPTFIDDTCDEWATIFFSAGKIGMQIEMAPADLLKALPISKAPLSEVL